MPYRMKLFFSHSVILTDTYNQCLKISFRVSHHLQPFLQHIIFTLTDYNLLRNVMCSKTKTRKSLEHFLTGCLHRWIQTTHNLSVIRCTDIILLWYVIFVLFFYRDQMSRSFHLISDQTDKDTSACTIDHQNKNSLFFFREKKKRIVVNWSTLSSLIAWIRMLRPPLSSR
jgi:hypothetical protein